MTPEYIGVSTSDMTPSVSLVTLTLLLRLVIEFPRHVTSDNRACPGWSLPQDLKEWPDVESGDNVEVVWNFDRVSEKMLIIQSFRK